MTVSASASRGRRLLNYAITLAAGVSQIVASVYLSRQAFKLFDEPDLKIWFLMLAAMPFLSLFELGATVVLPHRLASVEYRAGEVGEIASNFIATVLLALAGALTIGALTLWECTRGGMISGHAASLLAMLGIASAVRILANVMHGLLFAQGDNLYDKSLRVVSILVMTAVITAGLFGGLALWAMPLGWAAAGITSILASLYRQRTRWHVRLHYLHVRRANVVATMREAMRYVLIALPGQMVFNATPFIIASRLPAQYTVAFGLTQQLIGGITLMVSLPITIATPRLAATYRVDKAGARAILLTTMGNVAMISAAALALVAVSVDQITHAWIGHVVPIGNIFLAVYFGVMFIEWQQTTATTATMVTGNMNFVTVTIVSALLVVTTMPVLIGYFGFLGVPLALLFAQMLTCHPHNFWKAFRAYQISPANYLPKLLPAFLVGVCIVAADTFLRGLALPQLAQLVLTACIAASACLAGLFIINRAE